MVLWHLEVENQKPADIAPLLGMSANSVSALAYRAREGSPGVPEHAQRRPAQRRAPGHQRPPRRLRRDALSRRTRAGSRTTSSTVGARTAVYLELSRSTPRSPRVLGPTRSAGRSGVPRRRCGGRGPRGGSWVLLGRGKDLILANVRLLRPPPLRSAWSVSPDRRHKAARRINRQRRSHRPGTGAPSFALNLESGPETRQLPQTARPGQGRAPGRDRSRAGAGTGAPGTRRGPRQRGNPGQLGRASRRGADEQTVRTTQRRAVWNRPGGTDPGRA